MVRPIEGRVVMGTVLEFPSGRGLEDESAVCEYARGGKCGCPRCRDGFDGPLGQMYRFFLETGVAEAAGLTVELDDGRLVVSRGHRLMGVWVHAHGLYGWVPPAYLVPQVFRRRSIDAVGYTIGMLP